MAKSKEFKDDGIIKITDAHKIKKELWELGKINKMTMARMGRKAILEYISKNKKEA